MANEERITTHTLLSKLLVAHQAYVLAKEEYERARDQLLVQIDKGFPLTVDPVVSCDKPRVRQDRGLI